MLTLWRIDKAKYAAHVAKGLGAFYTGGRWTAKGYPAIYTSEHLSLALLEILVHASDPDQRRQPRVVIRLDIPDDQIDEIPWSAVPHPFQPATPYFQTQAMGDAWLRACASLALKVPSAILPTEFNVLVNPQHPKFKAVHWSAPQPIIIDERLAGPPPAPKRI